MVTQDYVACCVMHAAEATNGSAVKLAAEVGTHEYAMQVAKVTNANGITEVLTHEYVTRFIMLAAAATNTLNAMNAKPSGGGVDERITVQ
jgi:hypothetical protein